MSCAPFRFQARDDLREEMLVEEVDKKVNIEHNEFVIETIVVVFLLF